VRLNAQGNVTLATIRRITGKVGTAGSSSVFIGTPSGAGRPPGVYQRKANGALVPLFIAISGASYRPRFPMRNIGEKVVERRFGTYLRTALSEAVRNAR
jgi:hypothetical protein